MLVISYIYIVNFNLDKVVLPVGSVSESNIIIEFPFSDVKLADLYWRYIYRLRLLSVLILFRTFQKQILCCDENKKRFFLICGVKAVAFIIQ
jgi:hypothetical protein